MVAAVLTGLWCTALPVAVGSAATMTRPSSQSEQAEQTERSEAQLALEKAESSGERVEVTGLGSEYSTTYANPDGISFTLADSAAVVRVKGADGSWRAPDATLEVRSDGSVGPVAAAVDLSFSGGGDRELVSIGRDGAALSLGWADKLPEPVIEGATATYASVLPDVDLQLTATVEGFRELLVVKSAAAAASEELKRVEFALATDGVTLRETAAGGMVAADEDGTTVFSAPPAAMWDSAGGTAAAAETTPSAASASASLTPGTTLLTDEGATVIVTANRAYTRHATTYNLTVDDLHTYYVLAGETPVLVHNSGDGIPQVDNPRLQLVVNSLFHGLGNERAVGDGSAMAAANHEALGGASVEGKNHISSTTQMRSALNKFLTNDVVRLKGGKKEAVVRTARDIEVANGLISAIDDAHAGKYSGLGNYAGLGPCS
ncbi:HINT domain-containing protein [Streptomyces prunicolor]|uniref:polymorphic toxin-type HINT domain-containing protein n=1 Tax=Streptomyces prunicolor TaxID=67348 RepID=UPI003869B7B2|nr:HINT domain-containing protein [Streptomyces prunicolor]